MNLKKLTLIILTISLGILAYLISTLFHSKFILNGPKISILLPIFLISHVVLTVLFFLRKKSEKYLVIMIIIFILNTIIIAIPFPECEVNTKGMKRYDCDCIGIEFFHDGSECMGIRDTCYWVIPTTTNETEINCS